MELNDPLVVQKVTSLFKEMCFSNWEDLMVWIIKCGLGPPKRKASVLSAHGGYGGKSPLSLGAPIFVAMLMLPNGKMWPRKSVGNLYQCFRFGHGMGQLQWWGDLSGKLYRIRGRVAGTFVTCLFLWHNFYGNDLFFYSWQNVYWILYNNMFSFIFFSRILGIKEVVK